MPRFLLQAQRAVWYAGLPPPAYFYLPWSLCHMAFHFPLLENLNAKELGGLTTTRKTFKRSCGSSAHSLCIPSRAAISPCLAFPHILLSVQVPSFPVQVHTWNERGWFPSGYSRLADWSGPFCLTLRRKLGGTMFLKFVVVSSSCVFRIHVRKGIHWLTKILLANRASLLSAHFRVCLVSVFFTF